MTSTNPTLESPLWDAERRERVRTSLLAIGFDVVRFTTSESIPKERFKAWLDAGFHADMQWLAKGAEKRADASKVLPGAASVVMLGVNYLPAETPPVGLPVWARYAHWNDYHDTILSGLKKAASIFEQEGIPPGAYRYYTDTGPLLERGFAARAGMGFLGKNAMLISREYGNWLFLAAILVAARIEPDPPLAGGRGTAADGGATTALYCGSCTKCMDTCPTAAFPEPGLVDARRCVSYHTIENKGFIPRQLRRAFGQRIYGCDTCLEVCPWNRFAQAGRALLLEARADIPAMDLPELLQLTPGRFAEVFKGTAIKRIKLRGLLRNACIAAGNSGRTELIPLLKNLLGHPEPVVRGHAVWALRRLSADADLPEIRTLLTNEEHPEVLEEVLTPFL